MQILKCKSVAAATWYLRLLALFSFGLLGLCPSVLASKDIKPLEIYVSPKGNDSHTGSKTSPLKTIEAARDKIRILRNHQRDIPVTVWIGGGLYEVDQQIVFKDIDSGTENAKVVYQAKEGEYPIFSGSKSLKKWSLVKDEQIRKQLDISVHQKVYVVNLKEAGIHDFGDPTDLGQRPELFCNKQLQTLSRWPDSGFVKADKAIGETELPQTYISITGKEEGIFTYLEKNPDRWAHEKDVRLGGYWYWDWSEEFQRVESVDAQAKTIHIKPPYHKYGYRDGMRYFGVNLLCEITQPGEWYLDRQTGLLYWYPEIGVDLKKAEIKLSTFSQPFMVDMQNTSYFTLKGLTFEEGRGSAIRMTDGVQSLILNCKIERFGQDGIHIVEGKQHGIVGSKLDTFGCGGIRISGGDRKTLTPAQHYIEHTSVENFSLFKRTYQPAIHISGCGMLIRNNVFRYSSSSAFRLEGNDVILEYNKISHVVNESDDQGGLDVYYNPSYRGNIVRYNHWSDIAGGTRHGAAGVRLDDMISGFQIYGNIFERCGFNHFGGIQIHGGKDNVIDNNLFFKCPVAVSFTLYSAQKWDNAVKSPAVQKKMYEDIDAHSAVFLAKYPEIKYWDSNPNVNTVTNNVAVDCAKLFTHDGNIQHLKNNHLVTGKGNKIDPYLEAEYLAKFGLKPIPFLQIGPKNNPWL
jgi:hypothetical protein